MDIKIGFLGHQSDLLTFAQRESVQNLIKQLTIDFVVQGLVSSKAMHVEGQSWDYYKCMAANMGLVMGLLGNSEVITASDIIIIGFNIKGESCKDHDLAIQEALQAGKQVFLLHSDGLLVEDVLESLGALSDA